MRRSPTPAERALWRVLRDRAVNGLRFRRQHPLDGLVLDFFCAEIGLCVQLDGAIHDTGEQQEKDAARTAHLEARGIRVIRFRNEEVLQDMLCPHLHRARRGAPQAVSRQSAEHTLTIACTAATTPRNLHDVYTLSRLRERVRAQASG